MNNARLSAHFLFADHLEPIWRSDWNRRVNCTREMEMFIHTLHGKPQASANRQAQRFRPRVTVSLASPFR